MRKRAAMRWRESASMWLMTVLSWYISKLLAQLSTSMSLDLGPCLTTAVVYLEHRAATPGLLSRAAGRCDSGSARAMFQGNSL